VIVARDEAPPIRLTIPVSAELHERMQERMREGGFSSVSEYIRSAVRADLERARRAEIESTLLEAIGSEEYSDLTADYFDALRERVRKARRARKS
jgi:antitoxin ParD1/3/4